MERTNPGTDRITAQALRRDISWAATNLQSHPHACWQCSNAGTDVYAHCDTWWAWARELHRLRRRLDIHLHPPVDRQTMLPGMEDL